MQKINDRQRDAGTNGSTPLFSFYRHPVTNTTPDRDMTIRDAYDYIIGYSGKKATEHLRMRKSEAAMEPDAEKQKAMKKAADEYKRDAFDYVTFSGTFAQRNNAALLKDSGLICIDFDGKDIQSWDIEDLFIQLKADEHFTTMLLFRSPSGNGLKWVVKVDKGNWSHPSFCRAMFKYIESTYGITADTNCTDISRGCLLPEDKRAYLNPEWEHATCKDFDPAQWAEPEQPRKVEEAELPKTISEEELREDIEIVTRRIESNGTCIAEGYEEWRNLAFALAQGLGEGGREYIHRLRQLSIEGYDPAKTDKYYDDLLRAQEQHKDIRRNGELITARTFFAIAKAHGIDIVTPNAMRYAQEKAKADAMKEFAGSGASCVLRQEFVNILQELQPVNFKQKAIEAGLMESDEELKDDALLVVTIEEIKRQVWAQGSGLAFSNDKQYIYADGYWQEIPLAEMRHFLSAAATALGARPLKSWHFKRQDNLYEQFTRSALRTEPQTRAALINVKNGTLEIDGARVELRPARREDFLRYQLPYSYDPAAACPMFHRYLDRVLPDESGQKVIAEFVGNAISPTINLQKALALVGDGCNGKSVLCDIITSLLGEDNVTSADLDSLTKEDSRTLPYLENKMLNYCNENPKKLNSNSFKALVNTEPVTARRLYGEPYRMSHYAKLMFNCNQLPVNVEQTEAYFRRYVVIPFKVHIEDSEKDPHLAKKIADAELPGILNWVIEGLKRVEANRCLTDCKSANDALARYRKESNSAMQFIEDEGVQPTTDGKLSISLKMLYGQYREYCGESGYFQQGKKTFSESLQRAGFAVKKTKAGMMVNAALGKFSISDDEPAQAPAPAPVEDDDYLPM